MSRNTKDALIVGAGIVFFPFVAFGLLMWVIMVGNFLNSLAGF